VIWASEAIVTVMETGDLVSGAYIDMLEDSAT
jgi:hypothetical protein